MRKSIYILLCLTVISIKKPVLAQQEDRFKSFRLSFMKHFNYPRVMRDSCITTATMIQISMVKNQLSITLSDSANEVFKQEFDQVITKLETISVKQTINKYKNGHSILIPVYFSFYDDYCGTQNENSTLPASFSRFNGQFYNGTCDLLEPIIVRITKPLVN